MRTKNTLAEVSNTPQTNCGGAIWDRLADESPKWFARFTIFRLLGIERSIDMAWRHENRTKTNKNGRAPDSWSKTAKRFDWRERALAWDIADAERVRRQVVAEGTRRLKRALQNRQQREQYIDGIARTLRHHADLTHKKLDPEMHVRSIEWSEARLEAQFSFVERLIRLGQEEYAVENRLLAEAAIYQQRRTQVGELLVHDESTDAARMRECVASVSGMLANGNPAGSSSETPQAAQQAPLN